MIIDLIQMGKLRFNEKEWLAQCQIFGAFAIQTQDLGTILCPLRAVRFL